jgi:hypothetical protein
VATNGGERGGDSGGGAVTTSAQSSSTISTVASELQGLSQLHAQGLLSEAEFMQAKRKILQ